MTKRNSKWLLATMIPLGGLVLGSGLVQIAQNGEVHRSDIGNAGSDTTVVEPAASPEADVKVLLNGEPVVVPDNSVTIVPNPESGGQTTIVSTGSSVTLQTEVPAVAPTDGSVKSGTVQLDISSHQTQGTSLGNTAVINSSTSSTRSQSSSNTSVFSTGGDSTVIVH